MPHPFADHFSALAPAYAAARPSYPAELFAHLAGLAHRRGRAWDCGAGSGQATLPLASWFDSVAATDASAPQLARAPAHPRVTRHVAAAEACGLAPASADLVTVAQALHWFDIPAFFREAGRVLVPGGLIAVWCYGTQRVGDERLDRLLEEFYRRTVGPYWPPERRLVETGYRTVPFPFEELAVPELAMIQDWTLDRLLAYLRTWSATARFVLEVGYDPVGPLAERLAPLWGPAGRRRRVRWPLSLRLGRTPGPA